MSLRWFTSLTLFLLAVLLAKPALSATSNGPTSAREALDGLRGIQVPSGPDSATQLSTLNKKMDAAWSFFKAHPDSLSAVEAALKQAIEAPEPDAFFLLDVAFLLLTHQGEPAADLAVSALERIDPAADVIRANTEELFHFVMKLGASGRATARLLPQLDRIYLESKAPLHFFRAPHLVKFTPGDVPCMVYGVVGEAAASHLAQRLGAPGSQQSILELLSMFGSESDTPAVATVLATARDFDTVSRCVTFLLQVGGPSGRAAALAIDPARLDPKARDYLAKHRADMEKISFATMVAALPKVDGQSLSDRKIQTLLDKMEVNNGQDNEIPPAAIAKSGLPKERLLEQLKRIRTRSFRRETNHVFTDLRITNLLINALQFK